MRSSKNLDMGGVGTAEGGENKGFSNPRDNRFF